MSKLPLIIINGWGGTEIIWQPLMQLLNDQPASPFSDIRCIDLPGFGKSRDIATDAPLEWLASVLPEKCYALAWSLGGQLACALAEKESARFANIFLIASNPQFVASTDWPGMSAEVFASFQQGFSSRPEKTWKKFIALCTAGEPANLFEKLITQWQMPSNMAQAALSLSWLKRVTSKAQDYPILLATTDALVPVALAEKMKQVALLEGSHLLAYSQPPCVMRWLLACVNTPAERAAC